MRALAIEVVVGAACCPGYGRSSGIYPYNACQRSICGVAVAGPA